MGPAIGGIIPFAVGCAVSPIPIIAMILILFTPLARSNGPAYAGGIVLALFVVCGATVLVASGGDVSTDEGASDVAYAVKLVLGLLLLAAAARQWRARPKEGEEPKMPGWMETIDSFTPGKSFGMGLLLGGVNPKNLLLAVGAGVSIAQTPGLSSGEQWITVVIFVLLGSASIAGLLLYYVLMGAKAEAQLTELKGWLTQNNATVMAVLLLVFGVVLFGQGFGGLTD